MITFDKFNRRAHLYLGLFLMPWLLMYGVSSFLVIHHSWLPTEEPAWELLFERAYSRPVNIQGRDNSPEMRAAAQEILKDCNLEGAFWVNKPNPDSLHIGRFSFRDTIRLTYSIKDQRLKAERQTLRWPQVAMRLHFRVGSDQPTLGNKLWGSLVNLACIGIIIWVASGLIMWWRLPRFRAWGAVAVGGGIVSFVLLVWMV